MQAIKKEKRLPISYIIFAYPGYESANSKLSKKINFRRIWHRSISLLPHRLFR
jgi:hypothetical protein